MTHRALDNELALWEEYTDKESTSTGIKATLHPGVIPGEPVVAGFEGDNRRVMVSQWFDYIRRIAHEREASEAAQAEVRVQALRASSAQADPAAAVVGGSEVPASPPVPSDEETVEQLVEAKVLALARSVEHYEDARDRAAAQLAACEEWLARTVAEKQKAIAALKAMRSGSDTQPRIRLMRR